MRIRDSKELNLVLLQQKLAEMASFPLDGWWILRRALAQPDVWLAGRADRSKRLQTGKFAWELVRWPQKAYKG